MRSAYTLAKEYQSSNGWYSDAQSVVRALASASNKAPDDVARIIAALSPQVSVTRNLFGACALLAGAVNKPGGILTTNWRNACAGIVSGPKVQAFSANLQGDESQVTLDIWAWRALGFEIAPDIRAKSGKAAWNKARERYIQAANLLNVSPAECQAGIWCGERLKARFVTNPSFGAILLGLASNSESITVAQLASLACSLIP